MAESARVKLYPAIGCCGIDCGLCPRHYTVGTSRCPGCLGADFTERHPSCSLITCCVKRKGLEVCAQCDEFPCPRFKGWDANDSFVTHARSIDNLTFIKEHGLEGFIDQQKRRIQLLEKMLREFDDGRSRSFYCLATALLPIANLEKSLAQAQKEMTEKKLAPTDIREKATILKKHLNDFATRQGIVLKLRNKR
jgi:hypothetical protein